MHGSDDAERPNELMSCFLAGVIAAALVAFCASVARAAGLVFDVERLVGSILAREGDGAFAIGLAALLLGGGALGPAYARALAQAKGGRVRAGAFLGLVQALIGGVLMGVLPVASRAIPDEIAAPGLLMLARGPLVGALFVASNVAFGAITAALLPGGGAEPRGAMPHARLPALPDGARPE